MIAADAGLWYGVWDKHDEGEQWETDFEACAVERQEATLIPTSLLLAVDSSGSMDDPVVATTTSTTAPSKWDTATSAFTGFFADPDSASLNVALRLWPDATDGCDEVGCDAAACAIPQVPLDSVGDAAHRQALMDALANTTPAGTTPMHAALDGAIQWAAARRALAPDELVSVVLVTDGEPNGCDEDIDNIAALAAGATAQGISVYAVGIEGSNVAQIDQIASAGGTVEGYFVGSANAEAQLRAALEDIQSQVVSCRFAFPTESTGEPLSPDLVRVEYVVDGQPVSVGRVAGAAQCSPDGWYLDDNKDPTHITLCASTCAQVQGIELVAIEVAVGCECQRDADCPGDDLCTPDGCVSPCEGDDCPGATPEGGTLDGPVAVQGGALNCSSAPLSAGWLLLLAALPLVRREQL